jgi:hypothetical protein
VVRAGIDEESTAVPLRTNIGLNSKSYALVVAADFEYESTTTPNMHSMRTERPAASMPAPPPPPERAAAQLAELHRSAPDAFIVAYPQLGNNYAWMTDGQALLAHALP